MNWRAPLRRLLRRRGYDLRRYAIENDPQERRRRLLQAAGIDLVLDVGANEGQYAGELRTLGYTGDIVSFEPIQQVCERLRENQRGDERWQCRRLALGSQDGTAQIQVGAQSATSSLLKPSEYLVQRASHARSVRTEQVEVARLDTIFEPTWRGRRTWLKLDTQGFEMEVLKGATASMAEIRMLQLELSLRALYVGESTFLPVANWLGEQGLELVGLEPGFVDEATGRLLQTDLLFARQDVLPELPGPARG